MGVVLYIACMILNFFFFFCRFGFKMVKIIKLKIIIAALRMTEYIYHLLDTLEFQQLLVDYQVECSIK